MNLEDFEPIEQLAIVQGLYKTVAGAVSTKDPDSLRSQVDRCVIDDYLRDGIKSRDLRVNGEKVGTYSVLVKKGAKTHDLAEEDHDAFVKWVGDNPEVCTLFALSAGPKLARFALDTTGELPDGYEIAEFETPETVSGTTLKVDSRKIADALGNMLPKAVAGMLEGGSNG